MRPANASIANPSRVRAPPPRKNPNPAATAAEVRGESWTISARLRLSVWSRRFDRSASDDRSTRTVSGGTSHKPRGDVSDRERRSESQPWLVADEVAHAFDLE